MNRSEPSGMVLTVHILYQIALDARDSIPTKQPSSFHPFPAALVALTFSAATLEAFINEYVALISLPPCQDQMALDIAELLCCMEDSRAQPFARLSTLRRRLSGTETDIGSQPFQDLKKLFACRNALIHKKAEVFSSESTEEGFKFFLENTELPQGLEEHLTRVIGKSTLSWAQRIQTRSFANWSCQVVEHVVRDIYESIRADDHDKRMLKVHMRSLVEGQIELDPV